VITYSDGTKWLRAARTKNSQPVDVPLLKPALDILVSILQISFPTKETVFYPISNQEVNRSLKIIAGICDIKRELTFHLARHTFATTITLMNGVPIESISKMLGHSKLSTTMIYARVTQSKIGMDMAKLQERLNSAGLK
jgi:integrase/recombinase XerD